MISPFVYRSCLWLRLSCFVRLAAAASLLSVGLSANTAVQTHRNTRLAKPPFIPLDHNIRDELWHSPEGMQPHHLAPYRQELPRHERGVRGYGVVRQLILQAHRLDDPEYADDYHLLERRRSVVHLQTAQEAPS